MKAVHFQFLNRGVVATFSNDMSICYSANEEVFSKIKIPKTMTFKVYGSELDFWERVSEEGDLIVVDHVSILEKVPLLYRSRISINLIDVIDVKRLNNREESIIEFSNLYPYLFQNEQINYSNMLEEGTNRVKKLMKAYVIENSIMGRMWNRLLGLFR